MGVHKKGVLSLLIKFLDLKLPRICPKSKWKNIPFSLIIMLQGRLSPIPIIHVAVQNPAGSLFSILSLVFYY